MPQIVKIEPDLRGLPLDLPMEKLTLGCGHVTYMTAGGWAIGECIVCFKCLIVARRDAQKTEEPR